MKNLDAVQYLIGATGAGMVLMSFQAYDNASELFWFGLIFLAISFSIWFARRSDEKNE